MIRVQRGNPPPDLDGPASAGGLELQRWIDYHDAVAAGRPADKPSDFSAYSREAVRKELEAQFHGKCAYCESRMLHVAYGDIEHWRPKKAVDGVADHPGYWWLAASWENLLLSCQLCNQQRGKGTKFPIANEGDRARGPGLEAGERPLLLDPSAEDPLPHLALRVVMDDDRVRPVFEGIDDRGEATIDVFKLNREQLVRERAKLYRRLERLQRSVRRTVTRLDRSPDGPNAADDRVELRDLLAELGELLDTGEEFQLLARSIIEPFLAEITQ